MTNPGFSINPGLQFRFHEGAYSLSGTGQRSQYGRRLRRRQFLWTAAAGTLTVSGEWHPELHLHTESIRYNRHLCDGQWRAPSRPESLNIASNFLQTGGLRSRLPVAPSMWGKCRARRNEQLLPPSGTWKP